MVVVVVDTAKSTENYKDKQQKSTLLPNFQVRDNLSEPLQESNKVLQQRDFITNLDSSAEQTVGISETFVEHFGEAKKALVVEVGCLLGSPRQQGIEKTKDFSSPQPEAKELCPFEEV